MNHRCAFLRSSLFICCFFPFFWTLWSVPAAAGASGGMKKSPEVLAHDRKALDQLKGMTSDEIKALDKLLTKALTLYYDRKYALALPIFKEISGKVETMDVMFWLATCAAKAGAADLAIDKFRQMLAVDPHLHRVRLELAMVYFNLGRYEEAEEELETVLGYGPPERVKEKIRKLLSAIVERTKRLYTNARIALGIQSDSNVSAGPDREFIEIPGGLGRIGPLTDTQKALRDWVTSISMAGNVLYDAGEKGRWLWNTSATLYQTRGWKYHEFDFTHWRLSAGPWVTTSKSILKLPLGYAGNLFGHDSLYDTVDFKPSLEFFFTPTFSLRTTVGYSRDTYETATSTNDRNGQDNINRTWEINPNFYFNGRREFLSFSCSGENLNARERRYSYDALNLAVSYFKQFTWQDWDMEFFAKYKFTRKHYKAPALLWPEGHLRRDKRHNFYLVLSRNVSKHMFLSVSLNLIQNQSNTALYEFDKTVYGFSMGWKF